MEQKNILSKINIKVSGRGDCHRTKPEHETQLSSKNTHEIGLHTGI